MGSKGGTELDVTCSRTFDTIHTVAIAETAAAATNFIGGEGSVISGKGNSGLALVAEDDEDGGVAGGVDPFFIDDAVVVFVVDDDRFMLMDFLNNFDDDDDDVDNDDGAFAMEYTDDGRIIIPDAIVVLVLMP